MAAIKANNATIVHVIADPNQRDNPIRITIYKNVPNPKASARSFMTKEQAMRLAMEITKAINMADVFEKERQRGKE